MSKGTHLDFREACRTGQLRDVSLDGFTEATTDVDPEEVSAGKSGGSGGIALVDSAAAVSILVLDVVKAQLQTAAREG